MSENVDVVRSIYAAWERGDWSSDAWADPEIAFDIADGPDPGLRSGVVAMAESWRSWLSAWDEFRIEAEEYRQLDDEQVLVLHKYGGRGRASGVEIGQVWAKAATLFYLRDGKVVRLIGYNSRDRAFADLGLEE